MASYSGRFITHARQLIRNNRLLRVILIFIASIIVFIGILILFASPITKYLIEKYDFKYTGREIKMDRAYVNPVTGYIHFSNFRIYEYKSDSIFFSAKAVSINLSISKLLFKTYEITNLTLDKPLIKFLQDKKDFNFDDLIKKLTPKSSDTSGAPTHYSILNMKVNDGKIFYREKQTPVDYAIRKVNISSPGVRWNVDTLFSKFSFSSGARSGDVKGEITINLKNYKYRLAAVIQKFDLDIISQYLKDLTNFGHFSAFLDADVKATGSFNNVDDITASGLLAINDFHFGKNPHEDYASFNKLTIAFKEISPINAKYFCDSVSLVHPYFKYERYDNSDNIQTMFGKEGSNISAAKTNEKFNLVIEIANYVRELARNILRSQYNINRIAIYNADFKYNDYSLSEKFAIALKNFSMHADSIDKNKKRVNVYAKSGIWPYGQMNISITLNPKDSSYFDMHYHFNKIPATILNPYIITYTSFPLDRGTIDLEGNWKVREGMIQSGNHLLIVDPRLTKRINNKLINWIPMRIIMAFVRERGNVIDYQIPITGNLKDPKFHLSDVVFHIFENIFVKPVTSGYRMEVKTVETEIEKSLTLGWEMRRSAFDPVQNRFIKNIAEFLRKNPDAMITVSPHYYALKEKEYILFFEAKKKYFLATNHLSKQVLDSKDSLKVDKMSIKDPVFLKYLNSKIKDSLIFTVQEKCERIINQKLIDQQYKHLNKTREDVFMAYFNDKGVKERVKILPGKIVVPYNGFSFFSIDYKGEFPKYLLKAYKKMNQLNNAPPRSKFKEEREKSPLK